MRMYNYNILLYLFATCIFNVFENIYMRVLYMYYICVRLKEEIKLIKYICVYGLI
jgi:hypothetical protein